MATNTTVNDLRFTAPYVGENRRPGLKLVVRQEERETNTINDENATITISNDATMKVNRDGTITINNSDILTGNGDIRDPPVNTHTNRIRHDYLDTEQKRLLRRTLDECLPGEVREECKGLVILVYTLDEYEIVMDALKEKANRKRMGLK